MKMRCVGGPCHGQVVEVDVDQRTVRVVQVPQWPPDDVGTFTAHHYILQRMTWRYISSAPDRFVYLLHHEEADPAAVLRDAIALLAEQVDYE